MYTRNPRRSRRFGERSSRWTSPPSSCPSWPPMGSPARQSSSTAVGGSPTSSRASRAEATPANRRLHRRHGFLHAGGGPAREGRVRGGAHSVELITWSALAELGDQRLERD